MHWPNKAISMVIYQISWRVLSFNMSWQSLLGLYMDWSCHRAGHYVMHWYIRCINHNAMSKLIGNKNKTSEQNLELEVARITRDAKDLQIIHSWFTEKFLFPEKAKLMFISTILTAPQHSDISCDKANEISANIYASIIKYTHLQKCPEKRRLLL